MTEDKRIDHEIDGTELDEVAGGVGSYWDSPKMVYELKCRNCEHTWTEKPAIGPVRPLPSGTCLRCGGDAEVLAEYIEKPS